MGADAAQALRGTSGWSMLVNDVSLRNLIPDELAKGFGFFQSKPASAFSPVAVTPDELGAAWRDGRLHRPLLVELNGRPFGRADAGIDMTFDFGPLIAHAAKTRALAAGTIIGSGTVSNRDADGGPGLPIADGGAGYTCIAELRTVETIADGRAGDAVPQGRRHGAHRDARRRAHSIFGAIEQVVGGRREPFSCRRLPAGSLTSKEPAGNWAVRGNGCERARRLLERWPAANWRRDAGVVELVDAPDVKSGSARSVGSTPTTRTKRVRPEIVIRARRSPVSQSSRFHARASQREQSVGTLFGINLPHLHHFEVRAGDLAQFAVQPARCSSRRSGAPLMNQFEPLSATIMP